MNPFALLVNGNAKTTTNLLTFFNHRGGFVQGANLEHIGVIPAFFQRRVGEQKLQFAVQAQQPFLLFHDQVVGAFIRRRFPAFAFGREFGVFKLCFTGAVFLFINSEVTIMKLAH